MSQHVQIAIAGSGFSGLGAAIRLKQEGHEDFVILERAEDVGGTWRDNSYPGCACDVPSHLYSFSFAPNPRWSRSFSRQAEIHEYLRDVADRHDLRRHVRFGHELLEARWDGDARHWVIRTTGGDLTADVCINATGALSQPALPAIPGIADFEGKLFHSAQWDHEHALAGERVAVIGTGASAIQFVPHIRKEAARVDLYQRTAPWVAPRLDRPTTALERGLFARVPVLQRLARAGIYGSRELVALAMTHRPRLLKAVEVIARLHLRRSVRDRALRRKLTPDYAIGCKRILISNDYYPALARDNVDVLTDGIAEVRAHSIVDRRGVEREVDTIIMGTGFHVTDNPLAGIVHGADGRSLAEVWEGSPSAYRGTTIAGFPNLFMLAGPNTGIGHTSLVYMIEAQIDYIVRCLRHLDSAPDAVAIDVRPEAQQRWNREIDGAMEGSVWTDGGCASWYLDASRRNSTLWPGLTLGFQRAARDFRADDHRLIEAPVRAAA